MAKVTYNTHDSKTHTIDIQNENIVILKCLKIDLVLFYLLAQFR